MKIFLSLFREMVSFRDKIWARIISLALGLSMGLLLFTYNSYQLSYDNFQKDADGVYRVEFVYQNSEGVQKSPMTYAPLAEAMKQDFPEVEAATCIKLDWEQQEFFYQENIYRESTLYADTTFSSVFSYPLVLGDWNALKNPNHIFISKSLSERMFGDEPALGKQIWNEEREWVVAGVFMDLPGNTHLKFGVVKPLAAFEGYKGWYGYDAYYTYVRLLAKGRVAGLEDGSEQYLARYVNIENYRLKLSLVPLNKIYIRNEGVVFRIFLLTLLALVVLSVSGVNYVLLSVASLGKKARLVGIHRVNGATGQDIFRMFMTETGILLIVALVVALAVIAGIRLWVEQVLTISFSDLLTWQNLGIVMLILGAMLFLAGYFPARLLSSLSFMQIERRVVAGSRRWKAFLLGCQFMISTFVLSLLWVVVGQSTMLMNQDLGYCTERLYYVNVPDKEGVSPAFHLKTELSRLSFVEGVTLVEMLPVDGLSGIRVKRRMEDEELISARWLIVDEDFFKVMQIPVTPDETVWKSGSGLFVNQRLLETLHIPQNAGEYILIEKGEYRLVDGVCQNFQVGTLYDEQMPVLVSRLQMDRHYKHLNVIFRLSTVTSENLAAVRNILATETGKQLPELVNYTDRLKADYFSLFQLRQVVWCMAGVVLVIIVLGLTGYTVDEVNRRTKEIAIRKINGAGIPKIMGSLFCKVGWIAGCGIPWGLLGAYWVSGMVLEEFVVRYPLKWWIFAVTTLFVLSVMFFVVYICAYRVAAANPVKSLKSE